MTTYAANTLLLPWSITNDDERFKKILCVFFIVYVLVAIPLIIIKMPELTRAEKEQLPPQLARVMLEKQELPKPVEPPKVEVKKPEEKKSEEKKLVTKPIDKAPVTTAEKLISTSKEPSKIKEEAVAHAREQAQEKMSSFKDDLMEMRETLKTSTVETAATHAVNANDSVAQVDRSMITSGVNKGSGGINTAAYSRDVGGVALSGRENVKVKSGLADASKKAVGASGIGGGNSDGAGGAARSEEEVRKIMEQYKGAIFNIYNRALRENAALQGKVVVKMVIDPSGQIIEASIVSSELKDPELESKLLQRIKLISFSASKVVRTTLNYAFDFLPQ